jgi:hypothetical protein
MPEYELLEYLDGLVKITEKLWSISDKNNFEYFLIFMMKPTGKLGSNKVMSLFLKPFFDTLNSTIDIENAQVIDDTYPYTILDLCKAFFLRDRGDHWKVFMIEVIMSKILKNRLIQVKQVHTSALAKRFG